MLLSSLILFRSFNPIISEKILEYNFGKNFGQVFYDYSGNNNHAVNGESSLTVDQDTKPTDRGAFFARDTENCIKLPPNDLVTNGFFISPTFSIIIWAMVGNSYDYNIFYRHSETFDYVIKIKRSYNLSQIMIRFIFKTYDSRPLYGSNNSFPTGKMYIAIWQLLVMTYDMRNGIMYVNGISQTTFTSTLDFYEDNLDFISYIGSFDGWEAIEGYIWYFAIYDSVVDQGNFYGAIYQPGNCLVDTCPLSCDPSFLQGGEQFCISVIFESSENGKGNNCNTNCGYGCSESLCLDCQCDFKSCVVSDNQVKCLCPDMATATSKTCTCPEKYYFSFCDCLSCHEECATCTQSNICQTCISDNSKPDTESGCVCDIGSYGTELTSKTSCNCLLGYYKDENSQKCLECDKDCSQCDQQQCFICKDNNAEDKGKGCQCKISYFNSSYSDLLECSECQTNCLDCIDYNTCLQCKTINSNIINGSCICPDNSFELSETCICQDGLFIKKDSYNFQCYPCHQSCLTCSSSSITSCLSCENPIKLSSSNSCSECPPLMFYEDFQCKNCTSPCLECISQTQCTSCENELLIVNSDYNCVADCKEGFYSIGINCQKCLELCKKCSSGLECEECVEGAEIINLACACKKGYDTKNGKCVEDYFYAWISVSKLNKVGMLFSEETEKSLSSYSINITLSPPYPFTNTYFELNSTFFYLSLSFSSDIPKGTKITIDFFSNIIYSKSNKILEKYTFTKELYEYIHQISSEEIKIIAKSVNSASKVGVTTSVAFGIISNPSVVWAFMSTLQLISYVPLGSNPLTPKLRVFLSNFGKFNLIPNAGLYIFSPNSSSEPYLEARKFGFESSVFWINVGQLFTGFFGILVMWPVLSIFSKNKNMKNVARISKLLANYKYSFFVRFWIQAYLDIGVCAIVQLRSVSTI